MPALIPSLPARLEDAVTAFVEQPPALRRQEMQAVPAIPSGLQPPVVHHARERRACRLFAHSQQVQHVQQAGRPDLPAARNDQIAKQNEDNELRLEIRSLRHISVLYTSSGK